MKKYRKKIKRKFSLLCVINVCLLVFCSCAETISSRIPYEVVDVYVNLTTDNQLQVPGNSKLYTGTTYCGYGGIIVCCTGLNQYVAFDAACPYEVNPTVTLKLDGLTATCPSCKTEYLLTTGTPIKGTSPYALKAYHVYALQGSLHITN